MSEQFQVYGKPASAGLQHRKLFAGTEDDARDYVENNFPRIHSEPGADYGDQSPVPDAVLVLPKGNLQTGKGVEHFLGADVGWVSAVPVKATA